MKTILPKRTFRSSPAEAVIPSWYLVPDRLTGSTLTGLLSCLSLRFGDVITRICEICYRFDGYVLTPVMLSYLPKLYVISLDLQGLLLFDGSLSYTSLLSFPVAGTMLSTGFVSEHLLRGFALTPGLFSVAEALVIAGVWCSVSFEGSGSPDQVQIYLHIP